jgi:hypothetical protein
MKLLDKVLINNLAGNVTIHTELVYKRRDNEHDEAIYEITISNTKSKISEIDVDLIDGDQFSFPTIIEEHTGNGEPFFRPILNKEYDSEYSISFNNSEEIVLSENKTVKNDKEKHDWPKELKKRK